MREKRDGDLLRLYTTQNSQQAFAELGRRYARLVYTTCRREVGDAALAEDAAQGVFLLLSQKAKTLARRDTLADWLYTAARHVARNLGRQEHRRQMNEARAAREAQGRFDASNALWERIEPHIDDALSRLKPADRSAILLRFVQEQSLAEVGVCLGLSENTARMRVSRALEKIRTHLSKAGVAVSVAALAALLQEQTAQAAVPAALFARLSGVSPALDAFAPSATLGVAVRQASWRLAGLPVLKVVIVVALLIVSGAGGAVYRQFVPRRLSPAEQRQAFTALAGTWTGTLEYADDGTKQRFTYPTRVVIRSLGAGSSLEMVATYTGASNVDVTTFTGNPQTGRFLVTNGGPQSSHGLAGVGDLIEQRSGFAFLGQSAARDSDVRLRFTRSGTRLTLEENYRTSRRSAYQFRNRFSLQRN